MKLFKKLISGFLAITLLYIGSGPAYARIIFVDDTFENDSETYEIGSDDDAAASNLVLQFGGTNGETITFSGAGADDFEFSDDLNVTGGVTASSTITANGTLDANGAVTLGDGGDDIAIDSDDWDISSAGVASGFTGFTSTGIVNLSASGEFRIRENSDPASNSACTTLNELIVDTTDNEVQICTATGGAGAATWTSVGSVPDFEAVYGTDAGNNLDTSNGIFTVTTGTNDFVVDSNDWNVTAGGALDATSLSDGTTTLTGGAINGATSVDATTENTIEATIFDADAESITGVWEVQDNVAFQFGNDANVLIQYDETTDDRLEITGPNADVFIEDDLIVNTDATVDGTFDANGIVTIGDGGDTVAIDSSDWDINATGDFTGAGAITADGLITGTAGATISGATTSVNNNSNFATNINTGTSNGAVSIGGGSGTVAIDSTSWDISTAGVASGFTGFTSTGTIDLSGATNIIIDHTNDTTFTLDNDNGAGGANIDIIAEQGTDNNGTLRYNATANQWEISNDGGAFAAITTSGSTDFEDVYANDAGNNLDTSNAIFTITTGTNDFVVDSNDWNVTAGGALDAVSLSDGTATLTTGALNGLTGADATTENTVEGLIFDADAESITGVWEVQDDVNFQIGNDADFAFVYDETTDDRLEINSNTAATTTVRIENLNGANVSNLSVEGSVTGASITDGTTTLTGGAINGATSVDATTENTIEATIFDADAESITGVWEVQDNVAFQFGNDANALIQYDETTDDRLEITGPNADVFIEDDLIVNTDGTVNGTFDANGVVTIGDNGDNVTIDSSVWDITAAGIASGFTGITSTGTVDFSGATNITVPHTNSTSFTIDNDETGNPDQDVDIIAEQGTENNGILRYDDGSNRWEFSNDGTTFNAIAADIDLATAQIRRSTSFTASNGSFADVDFDTVDEESNSSVVDADTTSDDITVNEDGYYLITYNFDLTNGAIAAIDGRVRINATTVLSGSETSTGTHTAITTGDEMGQTFIAQLSSSDTVEMQIQASGAGVTVAADGILTVTKLDGIKGDQGLPGSAGLGTDNTSFTLDQDNVGAGANIDIIANQGSDSDGTLRYNATSNVWELSNNGGAFNQIATLADTDFEGVYTNDGDNTLNTSNGIFTINTGTNDFVVTSNDWSVTAAGALSSVGVTSTALVDVNVAGEGVEVGDGTAADHFINFDDGSDRNFGWDDSETNFSTFGEEFESLCGHSMVFWAEEAGTLSTATSGGLQFSWGNGNVAAHGAVQACPGQVVAMTMNCDVNTTSGDSVQVALNGTAQGASCQVDSQGSANFKTSDTTCGISFSANDAIAPITTADAGDGNGCTVAMYVRYD